jgi:hypothetical protein
LRRKPLRLTGTAGHRDAKPRRGWTWRSAAPIGTLRALNAIPSDGGAPAALRLAAEEVDQVKSALARIYEVTQHANHDITAAGDWAIVEGEAQAALNVVHEVERNR